MLEKIKLSRRLATIASYISTGVYFADIGSDHAYLPCYVCQNDGQARAIAGEVSKGPFLRAQETVAYYQLTDRIEVRLGNGLSVLKKDDSVTELVIAGMGGNLITKILEDGKPLLQQVEKIIVQPNNNEAKVRAFFLENRFDLKQEKILEENNQIYEILVAKRNDHRQNPYRTDELLEKQLLFGPFLMKDKPMIFQKKWLAEKEKIHKILRQMENNRENIDKIRLFERRLKWIEEVLR